MKIIINAFQYAPYITGTDRMASNFLKEIQKLDQQNKYFIVCSSEDYIPRIVTASNFKLLRPPRFTRIRFVNKVLNKLWRTVMPFRLLPLRADTYFSFHNMRLPRFRVAKRMIASNLDLIPLQIEEYKNIEPALIKEIRHVAKSADAFMSISNFSKNELCSLLDVEPSKVRVIHLAADPSFSTIKEDAMFAATLPQNFFFTIGGSEPRKNVKTIVNAYGLLPEEIQAQYQLLIVGGSWHGISLETLKQKDTIKTLGYVSEAQLASLYRRASAFIFASKYEGFGFTILEAMASDTPVITTDSSSLKEVAGNAALFFNSDNAVELKEQMLKLTSDESRRADLKNAGRVQAEKFSWEKSAKELHELLVSSVG